MADTADTTTSNQDWNNRSGSGGGTDTGPMGGKSGAVPPGSAVSGTHPVEDGPRIIPGGSAQMANTGIARLDANAEAVKANPPEELKDAIDHGYEPHDIALGGVFNFLLGLVITVIVSLFIVYGLISAMLAHEQHQDPINSPVLVSHDPIPYPLQPSMQHDTVDHEDMEAMRQQVHDALGSAGVTRAGRRHITIDEAMDQVLSMLPIHSNGESLTGGSVSTGQTQQR